MKKNIAILLLTGVFAFGSMGFLNHRSGTNGTGDYTLRIIKGNAYYSDTDKCWEFATFGVTGMNNHKNVVSFVDVYDAAGGYIARIDDLSIFEDKGRIEWFRLDLRSYDIETDFSLEIHVFSARDSNSSSNSRLNDKANTNSAPIDPEETILIVKYP